jgi:FxsC-like protein
VITPRHEDDERGLRQFVRLRSLRQSYEVFLDELAHRIVAVGGRSPAPAAAPVVDFAAIPNAFARSTSDVKVHFVVAAASRAEMDKVRENLAYYGPEALDWTPYLPATLESLASRARLLAADQALQAEVAALDDVVGRIERAREANEIVVVLVDWWITQLDAYQRLLAEIDSKGLGGTAVLVPASGADAETMENRDELRSGLRHAFRRTLDQPGALWRGEIGTQDAFDADLAGVIEEARNRLFRDGHSPHPPPGLPAATRPILRGP